MKMPSTTPLQARRGDPRGQVLVLFALMLVVLLLVSALAVDYGGWLVTKRNYQNATDAAALAGAQQLTRPLTSSCASGISKGFCAREAAWYSVKSALNLTTLDPVAQAAASSGQNSPVHLTRWLQGVGCESPGGRRHGISRPREWHWRCLRSRRPRRY